MKPSSQCRIGLWVVVLAVFIGTVIRSSSYGQSNGDPHIQDAPAREVQATNPIKVQELTHTPTSRRSSIAQLVQGPQTALANALAGGPTAVITMQPVTPKTQPASSYPVGSNIQGQRLNLIVVPTRVWLDIQVTGWAPANLKIVQITIDPTGYAGSAATCDGEPSGGGDLFPATAECTVNANCRAMISGGSCGAGEPSRCIARPSYYPPGGNICEPAFQDRCHPQHLLSGSSGLAAVAYVLDLNFRYGAAADTGEVAIDFGPSYVGTLVLDLPANARGLYTIGFNPDSSKTFLQDDGEIPLQIPIAALIPAEVKVSCEGDCDHDGVVNKDEVDPAQQDCNDNGICNGIEIDQCSGGNPSCADCNGNRVPDSCEPDCNANLVADSCDLALCPPGDPSCADCNGNAIPDGCDIASAYSLDVNLNGVPDECVIFTPDCSTKGQENHWTCPENWPLNGLYPDDDDSAPGYAVTLPPTANVLLDQTVTIPALILENGSVLQMTQSGAEGNLQLSGPAPGQPGTLTIGGTLLIGDDRSVGPAPSAPDPNVTIVAGGVYASATPTEVTNATLTCGNLLLTGTECSVEPCLDGGVLDLSDGMAVVVSGDVLLDGRADYGPCHQHRTTQEDRQAIGSATAMTFHTPPSIRIAGDSTLDVGSVFTIMGSAGVAFSSNQSVTVGGNWENMSTEADCFDCSEGMLAMVGTQPQFFEAAATDEGPVGLLEQVHYVMGSLEVASDAQVFIRDAFDNDGLGQEPCSEAVYVNVLDLGPASQLNIDNCRVYYQSLLLDPSAQVNLVGCGELMSVVLPSTPESDPTGLSKSRSISIIPSPSPLAGGSNESAIRVRLVSLHHVIPPYTAGPSIPFTSFEGQYRWVGPPSTYTESSSSNEPFQAARLQCTPHYHDWGSIGLLHVFGSAIAPSSTYEVQSFAASCQGIEARCTALSGLLTANTTRWGDVESPFNPPSTTTQPDLGDVSALVNKFRGAPGAPIKARALLVGFDQQGTIDIASEYSFTHIAVCIDAFRGRPYPHTIENCP